MSPDQQHRLMSAVIDCLIPGDGQWPGAGQHGLADKLVAHLNELPQAGSAVSHLIDDLPPNFAQLGVDQQEVVLRQLETEQPEAFGALVTATYNIYYTDPSIRQLIERLTGYPARPPQPEGYAMDPFDESMLDKVRQRGPLWRKT